MYHKEIKSELIVLRYLVPFPLLDQVLSQL